MARDQTTKGHAAALGATGRFAEQGVGAGNP
jgi:hypothetical protein